MAQQMEKQNSSLKPIYLPALVAGILFIGNYSYGQTPDWKPKKPVPVKTKPKTNQPVTKTGIPDFNLQNATPKSEQPKPEKVVFEVNETKPQTIIQPKSEPRQSPITQTSITPIRPNISSDQSQELMSIEMTMADEIRDSGPLYAYGKYLSKDGVLYDADGGTPEGENSAELRFKKFPPNLTLVRIPEKAMAYNNGGSSWGEYRVFNGASMISNGRYIAVWRRENEGWKMVAELAAGKDKPPPILPEKPNANNVPNGKNAKANNPNQLFDALGRPKTK